MRRWTRQTLLCTAIAAGLWSAVIFMPKAWVAAPAATVPPPVPSQLSLLQDLRGASAVGIFGPNLKRQFNCLARNIYWEAKSEPVAGKVAVAAVTINRVLDPAFPKTICGVVMQGAHDGVPGCQFSWVCDRHTDQPRHDPAWQQAREIAYQAMFLGEPDPTGGALYFHAVYVHPSWARSMVRVGRIGHHIFYRERVSAADETRRAPS